MRSFFLAFWLVSLVAGFAWIAAAGPEVPTPLTRGFLADVFKHNPVVRVWEFLAGVALGVFWKQTRRELSGSLALLAVLAGAAAVVADVPYPLLHTGLLVPTFAAAVLWLFANRTHPIARVLGSVPGVELGKAGLAIYTLQFPVIWCSRALAKTVGIDREARRSSGRRRFS